MIKKFSVGLDNESRPEQVTKAVKATLKAFGILTPRILTTQHNTSQVDVIVAFDEELTLEL